VTPSNTDRNSDIEILQDLLLTEPMVNAIGERLSVHDVAEAVRTLRATYSSGEPTLEQVADAWNSLTKLLGPSLMCCLIRFPKRWLWMACGTAKQERRWAVHDDYTIVWTSGEGNVTAYCTRIRKTNDVSVHFQTHYLRNRS
jgi:hypothetical protein